VVIRYDYGANYRCFIDYNILSWDSDKCLPLSPITLACILTFLPPSIYKRSLPDFSEFPNLLEANL